MKGNIFPWSTLTIRLLPIGGGKPQLVEKIEVHIENINYLKMSNEHTFLYKYNDIFPSYLNLFKIDYEKHKPPPSTTINFFPGSKFFNEIVLSSPATLSRGKLLA